MKLYIDKENIKSILLGREEHLDLFLEIVTYIKKGLDVHYNFSKEEILKDKYIEAWFRTVKGFGVNTSSVYCPTESVFPQHPISKHFISQISKNEDGIRSIYLIHGDKNIINSIEKKNVVLIGNEGEEYNVIQTLKAIEDKKDDIISVTIESWKSYCPKAPVTDIILCDEHYFKNRETYRKNNNELITSISSFANYQINLVVLTNPFNVDPKIKLSDECDKIKEQIRTAANISIDNCKVTIMTSDECHSRHLITNYYRINHTSCFHLIANGLKRDVTTGIVPNTSKKGFETTNALLKEFEIIAKKVNTHHYGDKKSNLIKFK